MVADPIYTFTHLHIYIIVFLIFTGFENNNLWFIKSTWFFILILLVPLVITLIFMNLKKWFKTQ